MREVHVFGRELFRAYWNTMVLVEPEDINKQSMKQFRAFFVWLHIKTKDFTNLLILTI